MFALTLHAVADLARCSCWYPGRYSCRALHRVLKGLDDSLTLIHQGTKNRVELERNYGDIPPVTCYPGRLKQVFFNILNSAQQAIDGPGTTNL